jgi:hypothetical protein
MSTPESARATEEHKAGGASAPAAANIDSITILKCATGAASKRVIAWPGSGPVIENYNAGLKFFFKEFPASNVSELSAVLRGAENVSQALVIRGAPRDGLDSTKPHRRLKANFVTPPAGRRWILIDFDKIPLPPGVRLQQDVSAVCEHLIGRLPSEFRDASCHWQLSTKAGLFDPSIVSMHLWFWLDRPIPDAELKRWARSWNDKSGIKIIDEALFNDVQAHYTAAPQFVGMPDPFPVRSGLRWKDAGDVPLRLPKGRVAPARTTGVHQSGGFDEILAEIGDLPGGQGFHMPIIRAVASYVATHGRQETDIEALYEVVRARVLAADQSSHDVGYVEEMASREHIIPAITTAISKFGDTDSSRRKSRQIEGIAPHFEQKPTSVGEASAQLQDAIDDFFG